MPGELISREALERIIGRAAELQAGERDIGEGLTKDELLALGQDVGIPARYLQQALLEEHTRNVTAAERGPLAWLAGPALLSAERVVPGERTAVERALAACADRGKRVPTEPLDEIIERAEQLGQRPLQAQALRVRGLQGSSGQVDLASSLSLFQEIGARPYAGRVEIELGELTGDRNLSERGLVALDALGDVDQLERVRERIARPTP